MLDVKHVQGRVIVRYDDRHVVYETHVDAVFEHVMRVLGIEFKEDLYHNLDVPKNSVYRCRRGLLKIPESWYLRIHEYSGIPVADLRQLSNEVNKYTRHK